MTFEEWLKEEKWRLTHAHLTDVRLMRFIELAYTAGDIQGYRDGYQDALLIKDKTTTTEGDN